VALPALTIPVTAREGRLSVVVAVACAKERGPQFVRLSYR